MKRWAAWMMLVLTAALGVRIGAALWWQQKFPDRFFFGDSESYWILARAIARGGPYEYGSPDARVFRAPGYPLTLTPLFGIWGDVPPILTARLLGAVLGTIAVGGVGWIAWRLFGATAAVPAALFAAIEPGAVAMSVMVLSEAVFCPLMVLHLALWIAASLVHETDARTDEGRPLATRTFEGQPPKRCSRKRLLLSLAAGLSAGAAVLARPSWLLFPPAAMLVAVVFSRSRMREFGTAAVMLLAMVVVLTPWWIRNYGVIGRFVPTTLQVGASLYDGWNPRATGASNLAVVEPIARDERMRHATAADEQPPYEYRLDCRLRSEAVAWARENPGRALWFAGVKFLRVWNAWPNEPGLSTWPIRLAIVLTYVPIVFLAAIGVMRTWRRGWPCALCWLPAVYFTVLHMVFVGSIRYRVPAMLMLAVLAGGVLAVRPGGGADRRCEFADRRRALEES